MGPLPYLRGDPPAEEQFVVFEGQLGRGGEHLPPPRCLEQTCRPERDDQHGQGGNKPEECNRAQDDVDDQA